MSVKIFLQTFLVLLMVTSLSSQKATNFTCNDCTQISHDFFTELDSGKVIILCWVMPCGSCTGPSKTTFNVVQSYNATHPGKVLMYLVDDYANSSCNTLSSWAAINNMKSLTMFSNNKIKMSDYGSAGMPKIVVVGSDKKVYYNANNSVNATTLKTAIDAALAAGNTSGIEDFDQLPELFPNPAEEKIFINIEGYNADDVRFEIRDIAGSLITFNYFSEISDKNILSLDVSLLSKGMFILSISDGKKSGSFKFIKAGN